jgi:hypothetical protein
MSAGGPAAVAGVVFEAGLAVGGAASFCARPPPRTTSRC